MPTIVILAVIIALAFAFKWAIYQVDCDLVFADSIKQFAKRTFTINNTETIMADSFSQSDYLSILTHAQAEKVKNLAEQVLPHLGDIIVLANRTGLVMLPYTDSAQGTIFHLGEVLIAEGHIRTGGGIDGYGMVLGRDVEFALGIAVLDAALTSEVMVEPIVKFLTEQKIHQATADQNELRMIEATRVEMETF